jgi:large subunit ribosomal protein L35
MPKQKTHKGLKKRIKITAGGKVKCKHAGSSHLMSSKNAKRRRKIASYRILEGRMARKFSIELSK